MRTADEQYAANLATLRAQPAMLPLVEQLANMPLVNLVMQPGPTGHQIGAAWNPKTQQPDIWLCDRADPCGGARLAVEEGGTVTDAAGNSVQVPPIWSPQTTVFTFLGVGLGYGVAALAKKLLPYQRLVCWDPEGMFFKAMLYCVDIQDIFHGKRVEIYVGNDLLPKIEPWYLSLEVHEKLHMAFPVSHSYTAQHRPADYQAVMERIMEMLRFHAVGLATWRQFGRCIGDNDLENLPEYYANPGITALKDLWKNKPAVCVAAGPSLQKNLRLLLPAEARAKVALITVGTTYALVQGLGLQPDITTTIDFQYLNWADQFLQIPLDPDCALVYLHSTYPQTVRRWPGPIFVAENSSDTMSWIKQFAGDDKGSCGQVQTVAHLNLLVALMLGANPIILLGQDLSMPRTEHHAAGARAQDSAPQEVVPDAFLPATDMYGQPTWTRHSFQSMLLVFERIIAEHPETTFINCSEQGLNIRGAQHLPLATVLAHLPALQDQTVPSRPLFQGETAGQVAARHVSPLRTALKEAHTAYRPQTLDTFPAAFQTLCTDVERVGQWAQDTVQRWDALCGQGAGPTAMAEHAAARYRYAACSADVWSDADTVEMFREAAYQDIIASENILQECGPATGMFVIRRFDFIELKGEIPPPADTLTASWQQARYAASRLARAAAMFLEELPILRLRLRHVAVRLQRSTTPIQAFARQHHRQALSLLRAHRGAATKDRRRWGTPRLLTQALRHTQQYGAALALMETWDHFGTRHTRGTAPQAQRIRTYLARYHADVRQALPAYFPGPPPPPPAPLGDVTHEWAVPVPHLCKPVILARQDTSGTGMTHVCSITSLGGRPTPLTVFLSEAISALNGLPVHVNGHGPVPALQDSPGVLGP
jgi:hypothetical protein